MQYFFSASLVSNPDICFGYFNTKGRLHLWNLLGIIACTDHVIEIQIFICISMIIDIQIFLVPTLFKPSRTLQNTPWQSLTCYKAYSAFMYVYIYIYYIYEVTIHKVVWHGWEIKLEQIPSLEGFGILRPDFRTSSIYILYIIYLAQIITRSSTCLDNHRKRGKVLERKKAAGTPSQWQF